MQPFNSPFWVEFDGAGSTRTSTPDTTIAAKGLSAPLLRRRNRRSHRLLLLGVAAVLHLSTMAASSAAATACAAAEVPARMPALFLSHGGGPGFFLKGQPMFAGADADSAAVRFMRQIPAALRIPAPRAIVVVSAHWETSGPVGVLTGPAAPGLLYDYYGFPPEAYAPHLTYPARLDAALAADVLRRLQGAGIPAAAETRRGLDHGVFIPLKVLYPRADVPVVQVAVRASLDPAEHLALGRALAPLRAEGVLLVGSGQVTHNMALIGQPHPGPKMEAFGAWVEQTLALADGDARDRALAAWRTEAPHARHAHPREEHLLPLRAWRQWRRLVLWGWGFGLTLFGISRGGGPGGIVVVAGASMGEPGQKLWRSWMGAFGLDHYVFPGSA